MIVGLVSEIPDEQVMAKFVSLENRAIVVVEAMSLISRNALGYGYRSLLENLPRDPHNSYVAIWFEFGFMALICVFENRGHPNLEWIELNGKI